MEGDGELHDTETRCEMAARFGDDGDDAFSDLTAESLEFFDAELLEARRRIDPV
jgi:hypothetical protein